MRGEGMRRERQRERERGDEEEGGERRIVRCKHLPQAFVPSIAEDSRGKEKQRRAEVNKKGRNMERKRERGWRLRRGAGGGW